MAFLPGSDPDIHNLRGQLDHLEIFQGGNFFGDANKFRTFWKIKDIIQSSYLFTFDDDLIYPRDYVERMVSWIDHFDRRAIVTMHGKKFIREPDYYDVSTYINKPCTVKNEELMEVDVPGTGCTAWPASLGIPFQKDFPSANIADLHFARWAKDLPIYLIPHPPLIPNPRGDGKKLWKENKNRREEMNAILSEIVR